jgi:hypothetical protein
MEVPMLIRACLRLGFVAILGITGCKSDSESTDGGSGGADDAMGGGGSGGTGGSGGAGGNGGSAGSSGGMDAAVADAAGDVAISAADTKTSDTSAGTDTKVADTASVGDGVKGGMTFFITSVGNGAMGGNLGGLAAADKKCRTLAEAAGAMGKTWRAYLSVSAVDGQAAVNARDRIGNGPWVNAKGTIIAASLEALHIPGMNKISQQNGLDEKGNLVPLSEHDMVTGSTAEGRAYPAVMNATCKNWTSNGTDVKGMVGHHNRKVIESWNSAHFTLDCTEAKLKSQLGSARFYCFASD